MSEGGRRPQKNAQVPTITPQNTKTRLRGKKKDRSPSIWALAGSSEKRNDMDLSHTVGGKETKGRHGYEILIYLDQKTRLEKSHRVESPTLLRN